MLPVSDEDYRNPCSFRSPFRNSLEARHRSVPLPTTATTAPYSQALTLPQLSRPQTVKKIWEYIRAHDLQVPEDKRQIRCDDMMRAVFKQDSVHMFSMNKLLSKQLYPVETTE